MKLPLISLLYIVMAHSLYSQPLTVYLLPGHGADERIFSRLDLVDYPTQVLSYPIPEKDESFSAYAQRIATQIDTSNAFALVGMSFGGMVAVEISKFLNPDQVILVSSAKCAEELPPLYKSFRNLPIHKVLSGGFFKWWGLRLQPLMEPIPKEEQQFFQQMLKAKDPLYVKRTLGYIINWEEENCGKELVHIHGEKDRTLPYRHVSPTVSLPNAGHMMVYTHAEEVSNWITRHLP